MWSVSYTAVHLGHTITSNDRDNITKSAKSSFWKSFNILIAEFGKLSPFVISKLFNQYCCSFYGSPLWSISGTVVQALCVDWRKALRSIEISMCSLAVSIQDSPAVEPRSNPGSGKILMSENLKLYTTSPVVMC